MFIESKVFKDLETHINIVYRIVKNMISEDDTFEV